MEDVVQQGMGFSKGRASSPLKSRFVMPPFTVLNTRDADWIARRRAWVDAGGIQSEVGRDAKAYNTETMQRYNRQTTASGRGNWPPATMGGTSIFDPVLCELVYRWFAPPGGVVLDPFAGGSVRGLMASMLGLRYWGCELRAEQVEANVQQAKDLRADLRGPRPKWVVGDSLHEMAKSPSGDFLFTCPPYGSLEVYSDDPADLSNMDSNNFQRFYKAIVYEAAQRLRRDSFAVWVVGNYREKHIMRDMVHLTTEAHRLADMHLYNEAVLVNSVGTGALRTNTSFVRGRRKLVKVHQNVLVYVKGDPLAAAEKLQKNSSPDVDTTDL